MENILTLTTSPQPGPVRAFLRRTGTLFLNPARFFHEDFPRLEGSSAIAFGLTNGWLAALVAFFVRTFNSFFLARLFERWVQKLLVSESGFSFLALSPNSFLWAAGLLLLTPFLLLARIFFGSLVVYLFTRLLVEDENGGPDRVTFTNVLRIQAVATSGRWFDVVPLVGGFISFSVTIVLLVTGIRERFALSNRRATAIVLAPYILLFVGVLLICIVFAVALSQLPMHELLELDTAGLGL